jgi:hypothetical protein
VGITASSFGGGGINMGETNCIVSQVNITGEEDVEKAITGVVKEFVRISALRQCHSQEYPRKLHRRPMKNKNVTGILNTLAITLDTTLEDIQKSMTVNCTGVFWYTEHQLRQMMKQDGLKV